MGILFLLGMMVCCAGITRLFVVVAQWSIDSTREGRREIEGCTAVGSWEVPDTVPSAWVDAYRAEQGG